MLFHQVDIVRELKNEVVQQQKQLVKALKNQATLQRALMNKKSLRPWKAEQVMYINGRLNPFELKVYFTIKGVQYSKL